MDILLQSYLEETEELLQSAEECMIRLEESFSQREINELFRIAHTIKGSSQLMGYEDIGDLMHKIEDMLDYTRNGRLELNKDIMDCCFEGLDLVKKMLEYKLEAGSEPEKSQLPEAADHLKAKIKQIIQQPIPEEKAESTKEETGLRQERNINRETGLVSYLLSKESKGKNKYYLDFGLEEDLPMVSVVLTMLLNSVEEVGALLYSSITDNFFQEEFSQEDIRNLELIVTTDLEEEELRNHFSLFYVERIEIIDLNKGKLRKADRDPGPEKGQEEVVTLLEKACACLREQELLKTFKPAQQGYLACLKNFLKHIPVSTQMVALDLSNLTIVQAQELKELIPLKHELEANNIELVIVADSPYARRIVNIFDSVSGITEFKVYKKESEAVLATLRLREFLQKLNLL